MEAIGWLKQKVWSRQSRPPTPMVKAANVRLISKEYVGSQLVTVIVTGEVGAVKAATEAGATAAKRIGNVVSVHVIPRPHGDVDSIIATL